MLLFDNINNKALSVFDVFALWNSIKDDCQYYDVCNYDFQVAYFNILRATQCKENDCDFIGFTKKEIENIINKLYQKLTTERKI